MSERKDPNPHEGGRLRLATGWARRHSAHKRAPEPRHGGSVTAGRPWPAGLFPVMQPSRPFLHTIRRPGRALRRNRGLNAGLVQLVYLAVAVAVAYAVPEMDVGVTVSGEEARAFLIGVGAAMVPFIGIVFSLLFLVVQFGTTTFTPRLNIFRDSPIVWHAFAFFVALLVYCFTASFAIGRDEDVSVLVPIMTMLLVLAALAVFRNLQTSAFRSIQLATALSQVANRGREVILGIYPDELDVAGAEQDAQADWRTDAPEGVREVRWPGRSQVLQVIDVPRLMRIAEKEGVLIECHASAGEILRERSVVVVIHGEANEGAEEEILKALTAGRERTFEQDPAFAFRILADIALRALSPAVNDPTTASDALDASDEMLRLLATRYIDVGCERDSRGIARVILNLPSWEDYVALTLDELISVGLKSIQVRARLDRLLVELLEVTPHELQPPLQRRLERVRSASPVVGAEAE